MTNERAAIHAVAERRDELVALASALIRYDTTAGDPAEPGREEAAVQELLGARLQAAGAETDLWEPDPAELERSRRQVPEDLTFAGRPQLLARFRGTDGATAPSLMLNGHIDVVRRSRGRAGRIAVSIPWSGTGRCTVAARAT